MKTYYIINAVVVHHTNDHHCVSVDVMKQIPTFLLDADIQGIVDEQHAEQIAREIVCPFDPQYESFAVNLTVTKVRHE